MSSNTPFLGSAQKIRPDSPPLSFLMRDTQMRTLACLRLGACFPAPHHTCTAYLRKLILWLEDASPAVPVFMMSYKHAFCAPQY